MQALSYLVSLTTTYWAHLAIISYNYQEKILINILYQRKNNRHNIDYFTQWWCYYSPVTVYSGDCFILS